MSSTAIKIFATGGTFDKEYNELSGALFFQHTHIGDMLKLGRCHLQVNLETLALKIVVAMVRKEEAKKEK